MAQWRAQSIRLHWWRVWARRPSHCASLVRRRQASLVCSLAQRRHQQGGHTHSGVLLFVGGFPRRLCLLCRRSNWTPPADEEAPKSISHPKLSPNQTAPVSSPPLLAGRPLAALCRAQISGARTTSGCLSPRAPPRPSGAHVEPRGAAWSCLAAAERRWSGAKGGQLNKQEMNVRARMAPTPVSGSSPSFGRRLGAVLGTVQSSQARPSEQPSSPMELCAQMSHQAERNQLDESFPR